MADIYVDSSAAGANDGTSMANAYTSITSVGTLSAGDRVWIRRTHAETLATQKSFTVSGATAANPAAVAGWPISGDVLYASRPADTASWDSDSTSAKPTFTTNYSSSNPLLNSASTGTLFARMKVACGAGNYGAGFGYNGTGFASFDDLEYDRSASTMTSSTAACVVVTSNNCRLQMRNCTLRGNSVGRCINVQGYVHAINCTLDGGEYAFAYSGDGQITLQDCTLGATVAHGTSVSSSPSQSQGFLMLGCDTNGQTMINGTVNSMESCGGVSVHHDGAINAYLAHKVHMDIEKTTATVRSGGGAHSLIITPASSSISSLLGDGLAAARVASSGLPTGTGKLSALVNDGWSVYCPGGSSVTITVYVQTRNWSTLPTAAELALLATYISNATTGAMATVRSTEAVSANATWTALTVTFTPAAAGLVYLGLNAAAYESGSPTRDILVDPLPVVS